MLPPAYAFANAHKGQPCQKKGSFDPYELDVNLYTEFSVQDFINLGFSDFVPNRHKTDFMPNRHKTDFMPSALYAGLFGPLLY